MSSGWAKRSVPTIMHAARSIEMVSTLCGFWITLRFAVIDGE